MSYYLTKWHFSYLINLCSIYLPKSFKTKRKMNKIKIEFTFKKCDLIRYLYVT